MEASAPRGCTCVQKHNRKQKLLPPACTTCTEPFGERLRSHMFKKNHIANIKPYTRTVHRRRISSARSKVQTSSSSFWFLKKMDIVAVMKTITDANNLQGFSNMRCLWKALTTHPPVKKLVVYQSSVGIIWQHQRDGLKWYKIPLSKMFTLYTRIKLLFTQLYTAIAGPSPVSKPLLRVVSFSPKVKGATTALITLLYDWLWAPMAPKESVEWNSSSHSKNGKNIPWPFFWYLKTSSDGENNYYYPNHKCYTHVQWWKIQHVCL